MIWFILFSTVVYYKLQLPAVVCLHCVPGGSAVKHFIPACQGSLFSNKKILTMSNFDLIRTDWAATMSVISVELQKLLSYGSSFYLFIFSKWYRCQTELPSIHCILQSHCGLICIPYKQGCNPLKCNRKSWWNIVCHHTWIATAGGKYLSMAEVKLSHDTPVCCCSGITPCMSECLDALFYISLFTRGAYKHIRLLEVQRPAEQQMYFPVMTGTQAVSLRPLCICLAWWNPIKPPLFNYSQGLLCSTDFLFVTWWCFYNVRIFLRALKCASAHKCVYST